MKNENFIRVYDNVFTSEHCDSIVQIHKNNIDTNSAIIQSHPTRKDKSIVLSDVLGGGSHEVITSINDCLTTALMMYADEFPILQRISFASYAIKLQKTVPSGGYHQWHCEQSAYDHASRILTWTVYLNDIEEGGETEFLYQSTRVKPKKGSVMFFPSSFTHTHRGNPPLSQDKYIATGWYYLKQE